MNDLGSTVFVLAFLSKIGVKSLEYRHKQESQHILQICTIKLRYSLSLTKKCVKSDKDKRLHVTLGPVLDPRL